VLVVLGAMAFASSPPLHPISKLPSTLLRLLPDEKTLKLNRPGVDTGI
jgi:hypothetical protein